MKSDYTVEAEITDHGLIETWDVLKYEDYVAFVTMESWLIETWDVLKSMCCTAFFLLCCLINRNMRCIEIEAFPEVPEDYNPINRNMRCIEILTYRVACLSQYWLIETWDVLK